MNVLAVIANAYPQMGGAQITVQTLLEKLCAEYAWHCAMLTPYALKRTYTRGGVIHSTYRDVDELKTIIKARRPDVLFASLEPIPDALGIAAQFNIPTITYFQSYEFCEPSRSTKLLWGLYPEREYPSRQAVAFALHASSVLLANSQHTRNCFARRYNVTPRVLYPEIVLKPFRRKRSPAYITGICGSAYKGVEIFLALADAFPNEQFLLVGDVQPQWAERVRERSNIVLRGRAEPEKFLSDSKIVLVPSQWAEPFGRIAVEAMGSGIPTLTSYTGGLQEIVGKSPLGVKHFRSPKAWRAQLAGLLDSHERRFEYGQLGQTLAAKFLAADSTRQLAQMIQDLAAHHIPNYAAPPLIRLRGATSHKTAYAMINAAWQRGLAQQTQIDDGQAGTEFQSPDIVIEHDYSEDFNQRTPPQTGKWVVVRTWDFGPFPGQWVSKINADCDQLWVPSRWVRQQAIAGGVDPKRVRVVPNGFDPSVFTPDGPRYPLRTNKRFKFIFVGAAVFRKGIDILLSAYREAFTPADDVCLVIKTHPRDVFYKGISYEDEIAALQRDLQAASIISIHRYLAPHELASLYRACDVAVFPYRAEGFGMPILEAMACGIPPIVPRFGACLDFCNDRNAFLMPARRISLPVHAKFAINTLGFTQEVERVDFGEVPVGTLAETLRQVYTMSPAPLKEKGTHAAAHAHSAWTWADSIAQMQKLLAAHDRNAPPHRLHQTRSRAARHLKRLETAQRLYQQAQRSAHSIFPLP